MVMLIRQILIALLVCSPIMALPQYTAREGRSCDSCHAYPFKTDKQEQWNDPEVAKRKCNLSCVSCHVDPGGGGLRTVTGRYLAYASLPIFNNEARPWHDQDRNIGSLVDFLKNKPEPIAQSKAPVPPKEDVQPPEAAAPAKQLPAKHQAHTSPPDYTWADPTVYGKSANAIKADRTYAPEYGIYGNLNADPKFQIGGDIRVAGVQSKSLNAFFPMQFDLGGRYHPVEHWTIASTLGLVGKADTGNQARPRTVGEMWTIRSAYVMYHELPYQMFLRAGIFQPSFGVRVEDHTAPVRQQFEMDLSRKYSAVIGAEAGFVANYPYLTISAFTNNAGRPAGDQAQDFVLNPRGMGTAINGGWRDLAWGVGGSFMLKSRTIDYGGNLVAFSTDGYFNLGRLWLKFPMMIMGEYAIGQYSGLSGPDRTFQANFIELSYLAFNGINLKTNHHYYDADVRRAGDESGRFGFGLEVIPLTFMKFLIEYRVTWAVDPALLNAHGLINPFDWLNDKQWIFIAHVYF